MHTVHVRRCVCTCLDGSKNVEMSDVPNQGQADLNLRAAFLLPGSIGMPVVKAQLHDPDAKVREGQLNINMSSRNLDDAGIEKWCRWAASKPCQV